MQACPSSDDTCDLQELKDNRFFCQHALGRDYVSLADILERLKANIRTDHNLNCGVSISLLAACWPHKLCHPAYQLDMPQLPAELPAAGQGTLGVDFCVSMCSLCTRRGGIA